MNFDMTKICAEEPMDKVDSAALLLLLFFSNGSRTEATSLAQSVEIDLPPSLHTTPTSPKLQAMVYDIRCRKAVLGVCLPPRERERERESFLLKRERGQQEQKTHSSCSFDFPSCWSEKSSFEICKKTTVSRLPCCVQKSVLATS